MPIPPLDPRICELMLANYRRLLETEERTPQIEMEILVWRAVKGEYEKVEQKMEALLRKEYK